MQILGTAVTSALSASKKPFDYISTASKLSLMLVNDTENGRSPGDLNLWGK
jgi:hypothetical protein